MDINNTQQLEALFHLQEQQAQLPRKNGAQSQGFEAILNQQLLANGDPVAMPGESAQTALLNQLMFDNMNQEKDLDPDSAVLQAAFDQASGALDLWDSYAHTLGRTSGTALRDAYAILEGIDSRVSQLKNNPAMGKNAALDDIINELEVMAATEKFKFNRGDYLG